MVGPKWLGSRSDAPAGTSRTQRCQPPSMKRLIVAAALASAVACGDRDRINATCDWRGDPPFALQLGNDEHRDHLGTDADLVVDRAIRYADATAGRMASQNWARQRDGCRAKLAAAVAERHNVSVDEVRGAAGRRSLTFIVLVAAGFLVSSTTFCRMFVRRLFESWPHRGFAAGIAIVVISIVVSAGATAVGALWTGASEMIRLGNEHVSGRFRTFPFKTYFSVLFAAEFAVFWVFAWQPFRRVVTSIDSAPDSHRFLHALSTDPAKPSSR
jgi:hypothetical protein